MTQPRRGPERDYLDHVAEELRVAAARKRVSLREISERSGLPYATVQKSLAGNHVVDIIELVRICRALDVRLLDLLPEPPAALDQEDPEEAAG